MGFLSLTKSDMLEEVACCIILLWRNRTVTNTHIVFRFSVVIAAFPRSYSSSHVTRVLSENPTGMPDRLLVYENAAMPDLSRP